MQTTPPMGASFRKKTPSVIERRLSLVILSSLAMIAMGLYAVQSRFDPTQWRAQHDEITPPAGTAAPSAAQGGESVVAGLRPMSPPEMYADATLSDKINGKAELYLAAGFQSLESRRFALDNDPTRWIERFVYTMGDPANAFAVYSQQRRPQAQPLALTAEAYQAANGLFLVQGPFYLELIGSDASAALLDRMTALAQRFVDEHPVAAAVTDERALFPEDGRVADTIALTPANVFGCDRLDRVFTAAYRFNGQTATAFLSRRASAAEAAELAGAYADYLLTYGGWKITAPDGAPAVTIIEILDQYEIVFHRGDLLAGVHEAGDLTYG
ncbi:MAG: DUF6599 family protein, partial [Desulfatitalea sp.]